MNWNDGSEDYNVIARLRRQLADLKSDLLGLEQEMRAFAVEALEPFVIEQWADQIAALRGDQ